MSSLANSLVLRMKDTAVPCARRSLSIGRKRNSLKQAPVGATDERRISDRHSEKTVLKSDSTFAIAASRPRPGPAGRGRWRFQSGHRTSVAARPRGKLLDQ